MSDIPEDVMKSANAVVVEMMKEPMLAMAPFIARAIMAERTRCEAALSAAEPISSIVPDHCSGTALIFEGGCLHVRKDGSGHIVVDENDFKLEDDRCEGEHGPEGSVHWIARFPAGEMIALRNFLNGQDFHAPPAPSVTVNASETKCRNCGSYLNSYFTSNRVSSVAVDGRLKSSEISCDFILGCDECSETLRVVPADEIARQMNAALSSQVQGNRENAEPPVCSTTSAVDDATFSAQVQDESEIVDCLLAGKPFVFDPATSFCHADDGGAPEHGIKYVPAAQVQDVADEGPKEIATWEDQQAFEAWAQGERYEMHQHPLHYLFLDAKTNAARQGWKAALQFIRDRSAAAPAKQEDRILHKHTNIRSGE